MKRFLLLLLALSTFTLWISLAFADCNGWFTFSSNCEVKPPYCQDGKCTLSGGVDAAGKAVGGLVTKTPISVLAQQIVGYFLTFVSLIAVIYIIYAGFQLMIGAGDEEKMKKTKNIILYVIVGIVIMWLAFGIVKWVLSITNTTWWTSTPITWSLVPEVSAYTESDADTFRDYQWRLRTEIQKLEAELRVNGSVSAGSIQAIKTLVQWAFDRLPDNGSFATENETAKRAVDMYLDIAARALNSNQKVGDAISKVAAFIDGAKILEITGDISATPSEGNAPLNVSFLATSVIDPSGTTPGSNNYIWWIRENGGVRRELGRGPSLNYTFNQEGTFTVNLDVISGSRNSKWRTDVLPLSISKVISVKPKLGEIILLINGVNVTNLDTLKINPTLGKMGIILDATASRSIGNGSITRTLWDFGNGNSIEYKGKPVVERQIFSNQGNYPIKLEIETNDGKMITKTIQLVVRDPSAVIQAEKDIWNIGDALHFSAVSYFTSANNVEYSWQIQDDNNQKVLKSAAGNTLNHTFDTIGTYIITLNARSPNGTIDSDSRKIVIESREPVVNLENPISISTEKPNTFVFDASKSYDPDTMSNKWLTFTWRLDGQKVELENITKDGARGTLTFDSLGNHTMSLTVANVHGKVASTERTFTVDSLLSVSMLVTPQVAPIGNNITFIARSENADFYEWNFGDGSAPESGSNKIIGHVFKKTGVYTVSLTVSTRAWGKTNQVQRKVYVTDTESPFAIIDVTNGSSSVYEDPTVCGTGAIVVNRSESTTLDGSKSVNVDGNPSDLSYTWSYFGKTKTTSSLSEKFGELGCFPIKLSVRSNKNGTTHTTTQYLYLKNQAPEITSISTNIDTTKKDSQKVLVKVNANGAMDPDGVITSYIWYYMTESDKEPQNVQITQKPEITFVLPNITEKYYFGVILEDNDGARTNSMDSSNEQTPLLLSNQNGNIYMPLITLTTPKTAVLAGENVHLAVEAKTIVGTNITAKSEYAWDFDGDGKIDQKTQSPSIDHIYEHSGNYTVKVRVTYNGVSNTKYQTIYVKNALKAQAQGYRLPDGTIYLLNASEGIYDKALWKIGDESTESLYSTIIPPGNSIEDSIVGTLTVSSNNSDIDTVNILLSDIEEITGSDIQIQSAPQIQNDTIHVRGAWDKVLLSMLGNTASRYTIDTNIEIDSDLDGIPDNDADNKGLASFDDGSLFVMKDFNTSRAREQKIKVTLFQGNTPIQSKTITLVFDFLPESSFSNSGTTLVDIASGAITTFDRAKLDELSSLIRSIEDTDRVILMKGYNTLIENWDDSFAKSKSLIDLQVSVDNSSIPPDKKASLTTVINDLLSGDAQATDDVTLAAKLIEWLVSKSPNATELSEKLNAIISHPQSLETNIVLAKEIFDLIQTDSSLDDETKQYIYNQLSVIKSGWTQSVPAESIKEETSSGWWILGFIAWVVKVFFFILGIILLVILIGYGFYRFSRKSDTIGFQDFLIDSVFHAKRAPEQTQAPTKSAPPPDFFTTPSIIIPEKEPAPKPVDPMKDFVSPVEQIPTNHRTEEAPAPKPLAEESQIQSPVSTPTPEPPIGQGIPLNAEWWVPDWLRAPTYADETQAETSDEQIPETSTQWVIEAPAEDIPDWLKEAQNTTGETITEASVETPIIEPTETPIIVSEDILPSAEGAILPPHVTTELDILGHDIPNIDVPPEILQNTPPNPEPASGSIPSWLMDSVKTETWVESSESKTPTNSKKGSKKKATTKSETPPAEGTNTDTPPPSPKSSGDIPDWLK
jgi:PKD repeat protein/type IV secretory pathway VirB2 component (pilin)